MKQDMDVYAKVGLCLTVDVDIPVGMLTQEELKKIVSEFISNNDWHEMEVEAVAIVGP